MANTTSASDPVGEALRNFSQSNANRRAVIGSIGRTIPRSSAPTGALNTAGGASRYNADGTLKSIKELALQQQKQDAVGTVKMSTKDIIAMVNEAGSGDTPVGELVKNVASAIGSTGVGEAIVGEVLQNDPASQGDKPLNATQRFLNLLATTGYMSSEIANSITDDVKATNEGRSIWSGKKHEDYNPLRDSGASRFIQSAGKAVVAGGKGLTEGLGARYDNNGDGDTNDLEDRAVTYQTVFEKWGLNDAVRSAAESAGATETGAGFFDNTGTWVALTGITGDIAGDPATYLGGLGLLKLIRGGARGLSQSVQKGNKGFTALRDAAKQGIKEQADYRTAYNARRDERGANRAARSTQPGERVSDYKATRDPVDAELMSDVYDQNAVDIAISTTGYEIGKLSPAGVRPLELERGVDTGGNEFVVDSFGGTTRAQNAPRLTQQPATENARTVSQPITDPSAPPTALSPQMQAVNDVISGLGSGSVRKRIDAPAILDDLGRAADEVRPGSTPIDEFNRLVLGGGTGTAAPTSAGTLDEVSAAAEALRRTATGQKFLQSSVDVGGRQMTADEIARALAAINENVDSLTPETQGMYDQLIDAFDEVSMKATQKTNQANSAGRLSQVFVQHNIDMPGGFSSSKIIAALNKLPVDQRADALTGILSSGQGRRYSNLEEAIAGSVNGELELEEMQRLLNALGIKYHGNSQAGKLSKILSEKGPAAWEQMWAAQRTNDDVLRVAGISDQASQLAPSIDVAALDAQVAADFARVADELGINPETLEVDEAALAAKSAASEPGPGETAPPGAGGAEDVRPLSPETAPAFNVVPEPVPRFDGLLSDATSAGLKVADEIIERNGNLTNRDWFAIHQAIARKLGTVASSMRNSAGRKGLQGLERAEFIDQYYLPALRAVEKYAMSRGQIPRMNMGNTKTNEKMPPLYVSSSQLLDTIDAAEPGLVSRLLFTPAYEVTGQGTSYAAGKATDEAARAMAGGITIYPNDLAAGAVSAVLRGERDPAVIVDYIKATAGARNPNLAQGKFDSLLHEFAGTLLRPEVLRSIKRFHDANEILFAAKALERSDEVMNEFVRLFTNALTKGGSTGEILDLIDKAEKAIIRMVSKTRSSALDNLAGELAASRLGNGLLQSIREGGLADVRAGTRGAQRNAKTDGERFKPPAGEGTADERIAGARTRQTEEERAKRADGNGGYRQPKGTRSREQRVRDVAGDQDWTESNRILLDDLDEPVNEKLAQGMNDGTVPLDAGGLLESAVAADLDSIVGRFTRSLGQAFEGSWGYETLHGPKVAVVGGKYNATQAFKKGTIAYLDGAYNVKSLAKRLEDIHGTPFTRRQAIAKSNDWFNTLGAAARSIRNATGRVPSSEEIMFAVSKGLQEDPLRGISREMSFPPIDPGELAEAEKLLSMIDVPFGRLGTLSTEGMSMADLTKELSYRGFREGDKFGAYTPNMDTDARAQSMAWADMVFTDPDISALDMLNNWVGAQHAAAVKPAVGANLSRVFGRRATGAEAVALRKEGWKSFDQEAMGADLARHLGGGDMYYPPEIAEQMRFLQSALNDAGALTTRLTQTDGIRHFLKVTDFITHVLKGLSTVYNPAHHMTSIMGEFAMLFTAGVNPLQAVRSSRIMLATKGLGKITDEDYMTAFRAQLPELADEAGGTVRGANKYTDTSVRPVIRNPDGTRTVIELSPEQLRAYAKQYNVEISPHNAMDIVGEAESNASSVWNSMSRSRKNLFAHADKSVGAFSSARDNVTRLAHFIDALESGSYNSLEDALQASAARVHKYHPTVGTLSTFERNVSRRLFYFYTWVRQALGAVIEASLDRPGLVSIPSKVQYNFAEAQGMEPDSFGHPAGRDPRIPGYFADDAYGATRWGGFGPLDSVEDIPIDPETGEPVALPQQWVYNLSIPQFDTLQNFFSGWKIGAATDSAQAQAATALGNLNPLVGTPLEIGFDTRAGGFGKSPQDDENYWINKLGVIGRIDKALGGQVNENWSPEQNIGEQQRAGFNWITGLKATNVTSESATQSASVEMAKQELEYLRGEGFDEAQIKLIRAYWKARRAQELERITNNVLQ